MVLHNIGPVMQRINWGHAVCNIEKVDFEQDLVGPNNFMFEL